MIKIRFSIICKIDIVTVQCNIPAPPPTAAAAEGAVLIAVALHGFGGADAAQAASLRFCFEFDVGIDCCGNLSEAENLMPKF